MNQKKFEHWQAVTSGYQYIWAEDVVIQLWLSLLQWWRIRNLYVNHIRCAVAG